jgi:hypothetical protein
MSERKVPHNIEPLDDEQLQRISGGECTASDVIEILDDLQQAYESLVDLTSYVIERVANSIK